MAVQIQARRGDSTLWTSSNPVLAEGELGVELDTHRWKVGDGTTAWNSLGYATDLELLPIIGSRTYTEQNYVTDNESVTASLDALDTNLNLVDTTVASHLAEVASEVDLGHVKVDNATIFIKDDGSITTSLPINIYNNGDEQSSVTGGWVVAYTSGNTPILEKRADHLYLQRKLIASGSNGAFRTNNLIDLGGYSKLLIEYKLSNANENSRGMFGVSGNTGAPTYSAVTLLTTNALVKTVAEVDISSLSSNLYVHIQVTGNDPLGGGIDTALEVYRVSLE